MRRIGCNLDLAKPKAGIRTSPWLSADGLDWTELVRGYPSHVIPRKHVLWAQGSTADEVYVITPGPLLQHRKDTLPLHRFFRRHPRREQRPVRHRTQLSGSRAYALHRSYRPGFRFPGTGLFLPCAERSGSQRSGRQKACASAPADLGQLLQSVCAALPFYF